MSDPTIHPHLSSHNPFRTSLTPNPTGASATSSPPLYQSALPFSHDSLTPTPTGMSAVSNTSSYRAAPPPDAHSDDEDAPEVLPGLTPRIPSRDPAHRPLAPPLPARNITGSSPSASPSSAPPALPPRHRTPSFAPSPPPSPPLIDLPPDFTSDDILEGPPAYSVTPDVGGGETVVEQGPRRPFQRAPEPVVQPPPPPRPPGSFPERPLSQMSNFAAPPPQQSWYAPPSGPPPGGASVPQQPRYAPPPGAPPPSSRPRAASTSRGEGSAASTASDGYPTTTPTPGRPLLRNGRTLVYPEAYQCPKCNNTGYKNFDPTHPCRKCWDRFGKVFSSILASSPWGGGAAASQSQHGRTFQRPLPSFKPPQAATQSHTQLSQPSVSVRPRSLPPRAAPPVLPYGAIPPPGASVVMPGDSRIGGRRCWRCGGRGTTPFLIFDEVPCEACGGVGRLFD